MTTIRIHDNRDMLAMEDLYLAKIDALIAVIAEKDKLINQLRQDVIDAERGR